MRIMCPQKKTSIHIQKEWQVWLLGKVLDCYSCSLLLCAATAAKLPQSCPTLCDPTDGSPPGSPVPGILQARTLEGLPFPSPMHESEKWKWSRSVVSNSSRPHGLQPTRLLCPWDFPGKSTGVGCHPSPSPYYCVMTLNSVLFQCKQDIGQFYYLFLESLSRVKMTREEASADLFHYWNCQNNFLQIIPHFLLATSDIQYRCFSCHTSFLAHPVSPVIQKAAYPSHKQVLRNEEKKEERNGGK